MLVTFLQRPCNTIAAVLLIAVFQELRTLTVADGRKLPARWHTMTAPNGSIVYWNVISGKTALTGPNGFTADPASYYPWGTRDPEPFVSNSSGIGPMARAMQDALGDHLTAQV